MSRNPFQRRSDEILGSPAAAPRKDRLFGLSDDSPELIEVDIAAIESDPDQARRHFDEAALQALAESIRTAGLKNPVLVRRLGGNRYRLIGGERRLRAHKLLQRTSIFALVTTGRPEETALIDNVQRVDLDAVELAGGLKRLQDAHGYSLADLGRIVGRDKSDVSKILSILGLPPAILDDYHANHRDLSRSLLIEIAAVSDPGQRQALWERAKEGATVAQVRAEKRSREDAAPRGPEDGGRRFHRLLASNLDRVGKGLAVFRKHRRQLDAEHRSALQHLRAQIDEILAEEAGSGVGTSQRGVP